MSDPSNTREAAAIFSEDALHDENGYALLTVTAQQAVLPRELNEGIYAILDKNGAVKVIETPGYKQQREFDWAQARSDKPEFVRREVTLLDVDSFIDYLRENTKSDEPASVNSDEYAHGTGGLELWGSVDDRRILAILDGFGGLRKHTATLSVKTSREWDEWKFIDGKLFDQAEFAGFIQDHISTIGAPDGGLLVDICETLTGTVGVQWKSGQLDASGQRKFQYEETIDGKAGAKGDLAIPTELTLVLRPFQGSDPIAVTARFRFRINSGFVQMGVKLVEPERILEKAFDAIVSEVQDRVPVHVRIGRP